MIAPDLHPSEIQAMCVVARLAESCPAGVGVTQVEAVMRRGRNNVQRWLQRLQRMGQLVIVGSRGVQRLYSPARAWAKTRERLAAKRKLVGYCEEDPCDQIAETFRFKGRYLCRDHIMQTDGTCLPEQEKKESLAKLVERLDELCDELEDRAEEER